MQVAERLDGTGEGSTDLNLGQAAARRRHDI